MKALGARLPFLLACLAWLAGLTIACAGPAAAALGPEQLAVVVNDDDPQSVEVADDYLQARRIPSAQLIHVQFPAGSPSITATAFAPIRAQIVAATSARIQAYAITWTLPYRVDCMSITSALTFGFDPAWCSSGSGCRMTRGSELFRYRTTAPFDDLGIRPSMMLAGTSPAEVRALIDRGVSADRSHPKGSTYLVVTDDTQRNSRLASFAKAAQLRIPGLRTSAIRGPQLPPRSDVMFYFIGATRVGGLKDLHFLPGAVADHLTSFGGMLTDSPQMSVLRWLEAGATGSYGAVREPCNFPQKFPDPAVLIRAYTQGDTLIEAYWKSVSSPGEGVFVGEPLARPWE